MEMPRLAPVLDQDVPTNIAFDKVPPLSDSSTRLEFGSLRN
jgi:hypothetical protein